MSTFPKLDQYIIKAIYQRLKYFRGNQSKTAISLGISRGCLRKYLPKELKTSSIKNYNQFIGNILNNTDYDVVAGLYKIGK